MAPPVHGNTLPSTADRIPANQTKPKSPIPHEALIASRLRFACTVLPNSFAARPASIRTESRFVCTDRTSLRDLQPQCFWREFQRLERGLEGYPHRYLPGLQPLHTLHGRQRQPHPDMNMASVPPPFPSYRIGKLRILVRPACYPAHARCL